MTAEKTAIVLIGYQNDYFSPHGALTAVIEENARVTGVLAHTVDLLTQLHASPLTIVSTPIVFTEGYSELYEPVGILKTIKECGAFKAGTHGAQTIPEIAQFGQRIVELPGKRGLNAFSNTDLDAMLRRKGITDLVIAGAVTSLCIDSTARSAHERGYKVTILSDCTAGRTALEQNFYCSQIMPLYAEVIDHATWLSRTDLSS
ncbi:MAG: cysteine hydrolase family protein [Pseudomonadota bacterium]